MNINYDYYQRTETSKIILAKPGHKLLGVLNGVDESSVSLSLNWNNTSEISFDVKKYIDDGEGNLIESSYYESLNRFMELYVTNVGWFKMQYPSSNNDGKNESKTVTASSLEIELNQYDLNDFNVGTGTEYSKEVLAPDNAVDVAGYKIARDRMIFHRDTSEYRDLIASFKNTDKTIVSLIPLFIEHPIVLRNDWRFGITIDDDLKTTLFYAISNVTNPGIKASLQEIYNNLSSYTEQTIKVAFCDIYPEILDSVNFEIDYSNPDSETDYTLEELMDLEYSRMLGLSFLDVVLQDTGWTVGYVDDRLPDIDNPNIINKDDASTLLSDKVNAFEDINQDVYSFLRQDVQSAYNCVFDFDTKNYIVNVYRLDCIGEDTNIFIGFRNIQNSVDCSVDDDSIYTTFNVSGENEDLSIVYVNFGSNQIENIDYFLTDKYLNQDLIDKYNSWKNYRDKELVDCINMEGNVDTSYGDNGKVTRRQYYTYLSKLYNQQLQTVTEIKNRVPNENYQTDWSTLSDDELDNQLSLYEAQITGLEHLYVDDNGDFDLEAIKKSPDWDEYNSIKNYAIPNIKIEMNARDLSEDVDTSLTADDYDYIDDWETDWELYGLDELLVKKQEYINTLVTYKKNGYNLEYADFLKFNEDKINPDITDDDLIPDESPDDNLYNSWQAYHGEWNDTVETYNSLLAALGNENDELSTTRYGQYNLAVKKQNEINNKRTELAKSVQKDVFGFTDDDLFVLNKIYNNTDYVDSSLSVLYTDDTVSIIDTQEKLYQNAMEELSIQSQPQITYETTQDNILSLYEYKEQIPEFTFGNYIRISIRDDYQVKLRLIGITFNPLLLDNNLDLKFSNMIVSRSKRNDFADIIDRAISTAKNQITNSYSTDKTGMIEVSDALIKQILNSMTYQSNAQSIATGSILAGNGVINSALIKYLKVENLEAELAKVDHLDADSAFIKYLESTLIVAGEIDVDDLKAKLATIDVANIGGAFIQSLQAMSSHTVESIVNKEYVKDLVANYITVGDLAAGDITISDQMRILSENGNLIMNGSVMQFMGKNADGEDYVGIQIGYGTDSKPSIIIRDENGSSILTSSGITSNAIADGLIVNNMVSDGTLSKDKLNFPIIEPNEYGGIDIDQIYDGSGGKFGVEYTSFKNQISQNVSNIESDLSSLSDMVQSVELTGDQVFIEDENGISPASLTITATTKNGLEIGKWYIDGVENTSYVSSDKTNIIIPSSYMENRKTALIKVEGTDPSKYDVMSIYKVVDGSDAYTVVISSSNGTTFKTDSGVTSSQATCTVYKGSEKITPKSYNWMYADNNDTWKTLGTGETVNVPLSTSIARKRVKCQVEI